MWSDFAKTSSLAWFVWKYHTGPVHRNMTYLTTNDKSPSDMQCQKWSDDIGKLPTKSTLLFIIHFLPSFGSRSGHGFWFWNLCGYLVHWLYGFHSGVCNDQVYYNDTNLLTNAISWFLTNAVNKFLTNAINNWLVIHACTISNINYF